MSASQYGQYNTIWSQLSSPNPSSGAIPFVGLDGGTIGTDVAKWSYTVDGATLTGTMLAGQMTIAKGLRVTYADVSAAPVPVYTLNGVISGKVAIPIGASSVTVNNSNCFATSIVQLQLMSLDATATRVIPNPGNGSFTITANAAATAATVVAFNILNTIP